ncbi:hypothetical protein, partial [Kluyvera sichuanensis]|uniref:hypothetical protein n=1 Tax=Kluyvera sichuanensis TaxID=2725494 RepID=UPI0039F634D6
LFVGKTLLHGDVLMWLMKTLLTSGCTNQRGAGQLGMHAMVDESMLIDTLDMDAMYDLEEGGGACITCYK